MPNGRVHRRVGRPTGAVYAAVQATRSPLGNPIAESLAGWFGGDLGARLPDLLEPGCWNHRQAAHSAAAAAVLIRSTAAIQAWAELCRVRARQHRAIAADPRLDSVDQFAHCLAELFWSGLAGFLNGLLAGYLSHLALDAMTPSSIPILGSP